MPSPTNHHRNIKGYSAAFALLLLVISCVGCGRKSEPIDEYLQRLSDPEAGMAVVKHTNGLLISARYLSPELRAYQELRSRPEASRQERDSLVRFNARSLAFLVTIKLDAAGDITSRGIRSYDEFVRRAVDLNFNMQERLALTADGVAHRPVLVALDNEYGMGGARNLTVVFVDEHDPDRLTRSKTLDLSLTDDIYETGISHFVFNGETIAQAPTLALAL